VWCHCTGFYEDYSSGNAVAALQSALAPTCKCLRNGEVVAGTASVGLVPGDVVLLRLGDVVPADCFILDDGDSLKIDQSSLTGESIPVDRFPGDEIYSGSIGTAVARCARQRISANNRQHHHHHHHHQQSNRVR
jgi:H+-transporting ATPase